jgi:glycosyltransferase involved in cell wall biosynthesis
MDCSNCLISIHRAEGSGLPIAEAMFMGKPVIATGQSGNMYFMNSGNSLPIRFEILEIEEGIPPSLYGKGYHWADPDLQHAAEMMQRIASDRDRAYTIGGKARNVARSSLSPEAVGKLMGESLTAIKRGTLHYGG